MTTIRQKLAKPWVIMPLVALLAFGGWFGFLRPDDSTPATTADTTQPTIAATKGTLAKTVSADGTVAAADTDDLSFTSAGTVTAVNVAAGDTVKKGQVLATLDSAALQAAVTDAQSTVADAEATLSDDTDAGASDAQIEADQSSLDTANDSLTSANEALAGAQLVATFNGTVATVGISVGDQLSSGGTGGTGQTGTGSGSGKTAGNLGSSTGSTGQGNTSSSSSASTSTAQIQVISTGKFTVDLSLDSSDISNVKVGQVASVAVSTSTATTGRNGFGGFGGGNFGGFGNTAATANQSSSGSTTTTTTTPATTDTGPKGLVTEVGKVADASSGVASYPVTVAFDDTSGAFNVGATVTVAITYDEVTDAVQVPTLAISTGTDGGSTVTVSKDGKEETRTVTTGLVSGAMTQITSGITEGETVVLALPGGFGGGGNRTGTGGTGTGRTGTGGPPTGAAASGGGS